MRGDGPLSADGLTAALHEVHEDAPADAFAGGFPSNPSRRIVATLLEVASVATEQTRHLRTGGPIRQLQFRVFAPFASLKTTWIRHAPRCRGAALTASPEPGRYWAKFSISGQAADRLRPLDIVPE